MTKWLELTLIAKVPRLVSLHLCIECRKRINTHSRQQPFSDFIRGISNSKVRVMFTYNLSNLDNDDCSELNSSLVFDLLVCLRKCEGFALSVSICIGLMLMQNWIRWRKETGVLRDKRPPKKTSLSFQSPLTGLVRLPNKCHHPHNRCCSHHWHQFHYYHHFHNNNNNNKMIYFV